MLKSFPLTHSPHQARALRAQQQFETFIRAHRPDCFEHSTKLVDACRHRHRTNAWFKRERARHVRGALSLFERIATESGAAFDVSWVRALAEVVRPDAAKAVVVGADFRPELERSRLKLAFSVVDDADAVTAACRMGPMAPGIAAAIRPQRLLFGVAIDGEGHRHVKLYPSFHLDGDDASRFERYAAEFLSPAARELALACRRVFVTEGPPERGSPLVLHFRPKTLDTFVRGPLFRGTSVHDELLHQKALGYRPLMVSAEHDELRAGRLTTCNLYAFDRAS